MTETEHDPPGVPEVPAPTPGQAAYEEWKRQFDASLLEDWTEDLADSERAGWEAVAQVSFVALVNLAEGAKESQRAWDELVNSKQERHPSREVNLITDDEREQPAPELDAAKAEIAARQRRNAEAVLAEPDALDDLAAQEAKPAPGPSAAIDALTKVAESHERAMYAAAIDIRLGDPGAAKRILGEQLDGWEGPEWDGTETGLQYLSRVRGDS